MLLCLPIAPLVILIRKPTHEPLDKDNPLDLQPDALTYIFREKKNADLIREFFFHGDIRMEDVSIIEAA